MSIYFKVKDCETGPTLYVDMEEAKSILDSMAENKIQDESQEKYSFEAVEMSEQEFKNLPEFTGF